MNIHLFTYTLIHLSYAMHQILGLERFVYNPNPASAQQVHVASIFSWMDLLIVCLVAHTILNY